MSKTRVAVVTAVNENPRYSGCAELFMDAWLAVSKKSKFEYVPVVINVSSIDMRGADPGEASHGEPKTAFVAQNIRSLACAGREEPLAMTSDVDMLPASSPYFDLIASRSLTDSTFVVGRDVLQKGQVPICYNVAPPRIWSEVVGLSSREDTEEALWELWLQATSTEVYSGLHGGEGWHFDQEWLYKRLFLFEEQGGIVDRLKDEQTGHKRLDRSLRWKWRMQRRLQGVARGEFADFHLPLPVPEHQNLVNQFLKHL